jgi:hypothetical protein
LLSAKCKQNYKQVSLLSSCMKKNLFLFLILLLNGLSSLSTAQNKAIPVPGTGKETLPLGKWAAVSGNNSDSLTLLPNGTFTELTGSVYPDKKKKTKMLVVKKALTGDWQVKSVNDEKLVLSFSWIEAGSKVIHTKQLFYMIRKDQIADHHRY